MRQRLARSVVLAVSWGLLAVLSAGCGLLRVPAPVAPPAPAEPPAPAPPAATPAPPTLLRPSKPAATPEPKPTVDVEALVVQAVAQDLGVSEGFVRAYLRGSGIDVGQRLVDAGVGADEVDDVIAEARARGVDTPAELRAFIAEVAKRPRPQSSSG